MHHIVNFLLTAIKRRGGFQTYNIFRTCAGGEDLSVLEKRCEDGLYENFNVVKSSAGASDLLKKWLLLLDQAIISDLNKVITIGKKDMIETKEEDILSNITYS